MSDSPLTARVSGYHDFGGLAGLRGEAANGDQAGALRETAKQFEAYFIQHVMKTMRESIQRSDLVESGNADQFQELMDKEISIKMAERGSLGLADMLERSLKQRMEPTAHQALTDREKAWPPKPASEAMALPGGPAAAMPLPPRTPGPMPLKVRAMVKGLTNE